MRVEELDYALPPELIAQAPTEDRAGARLLVVDEKRDAMVRDLADFVEPGTLIVVNDTKVIPARILGTKESGGKAEVFLVRRIETGPGFERWRAMGRTSKIIKPGARVHAGKLLATFEGKADDGLFVVKLEADGDVAAVIEAAGRVPLPPYIRRDPTKEDEARYQTIFARSPGAVAAPTAGLHLDDALVAKLKAKDCAFEACTLHVGLGTFQPVTVDDLDQHPMHVEAYEVPDSVGKAIERTRAAGKKVMAIGTTVVRALESARDDARPGFVKPGSGDTRLLIQPGYRFRVVDRLLTNFHLPKSTLLALVSAFGGTESVRAAYAHAVEARYRFFSYGDAMLLDRKES